MLTNMNREWATAVTLARLAPITGVAPVRCAAVLAAQAEIERLSGEAKDLALLVRRLARAVDKPSGNTLLARQAVDYLRRTGRAGSPLRDEACPSGKCSDPARECFGSGCLEGPNV